ncbi:ABC transporter substrate-binding protein [Paenibacillus paridis]|uniref:ABC transporter substrate-binding protein n=1 Tax=Paenibacillus paridis TaxID=2583376 RepID=UPI00111D33DD|nr:sugar ABC transporter substrate-binding protein [Paenibacillus paridis]
MNKRFGKLAIILLTVMLIGIVSTGCGSNSNDKGNSSSGNESAGSNAGTSGKIEKLIYYGFSEWVTDPNFAPVFEELKERFAKENPGFEVEFQSDPWGTWETKYKVMFASGNAPDVFIVNNPDFPTFANSGYLLDLGEKLSEDAFKDFFPGILSMYTWNGKPMAMPYTTDARILWYNKELFKQAGLDPMKPPATWSELKDYALKIADATDAAGFGMDLGLKEFPAQSLFTASGSSIIQVDDSGAITPNVNTSEFKDYLQLLKDMGPAYEADYATLDHLKVATLFAQQKVGMVLAGTWVTDQNPDLKNADFYGQALVPKYNEGAADGSFGGGFGIAVSAKSKHPEQALKLAQLLTSVDFNARTMSDVPANNASLAVSKFATDPAYKIFMDQIKFARQSQPKTLFYKEIDAAVYDSVNKVLLGGEAAEAEAGKLEAKINEIIAQK